MEKTKLGVSIGLLGAGIFAAALFGGYVATIVLAGYVLLMETNEWLRRAAVKALNLGTIKLPVIDDIINKYV